MYWPGAKLLTLALLTGVLLNIAERPARAAEPLPEFAGVTARPAVTIATPTPTPPTPPQQILNPVQPILFGDFDANGDGVTDKIIIHNPDATHKVSRAAVISGVDNTIQCVIRGTDPSRRFQRIAPSAADANGDGMSDVILMSVPKEDTQSTIHTIVIGVYSGINGSLLRAFTSIEEGDAFGVSATFVGDVDGDGLRDIAIGSPMYGNNNRGIVYIYSVVSGVLLRTHEGRGAGQALGESVVDLGDITGDGQSDYAAGAPSIDPNRPGSVLIYDGSSGLMIRILTGGNGEAFGARLSALLDINGDAVPDLAIASPGSGVAQASIAGGIVRIYDGSNGSLIRTIAPPDSGYAFGISLATTESDEDGDGVPELIITAIPADDPTNTMRLMVYTVSSGSGQTLSVMTLGSIMGAQPLQTDFNSDGIANNIDVMIMIDAITNPVTSQPKRKLQSQRFDLNHDGIVDTLDLSIVISNLDGDKNLPQYGYNNVGDICGQSAGIGGALFIAIRLGCLVACGAPYLLGPYFGFGILACQYCVYAELGVNAAETIAVVGCGLDFLGF